MDDAVAQSVEAAPRYFRVSERKIIVKLIRELAYLAEVEDARLGQHRIGCKFFIAHTVTVCKYLICVTDYFLRDCLISHR